MKLLFLFLSFWFALFSLIELLYTYWISWICPLGLLSFHSSKFDVINFFLWTSEKNVPGQSFKLIIWTSAVLSLLFPVYWILNFDQHVYWIVKADRSILKISSLWLWFVNLKIIILDFNWFPSVVKIKAQFILRLKVRNFKIFLIVFFSGKYLFGVRNMIEYLHFSFPSCSLLFLSFCSSFKLELDFTRSFKFLLFKCRTGQNREVCGLFLFLQYNFESNLTQIFY